MYRGKALIRFGVGGARRWRHQLGGGTKRKIPCNVTRGPKIYTIGPSISPLLPPPPLFACVLHSQPSHCCLNSALARLSALAPLVSAPSLRASRSPRLYPVQREIQAPQKCAARVLRNESHGRAPSVGRFDRLARCAQFARLHPCHH